MHHIDTDNHWSYMNGEKISLSLHKALDGLLAGSGFINAAVTTWGV